MAQELKVMVGVPASGKSSWIKYETKKLEEEEGKTCAVVSRDVIRKAALQEGESYFAREDEVFMMFVEKINECLRSGFDIVFADATHINTKSRAKLMRYMMPPVGTRLTFEVMDTPLDTMLKRNASRKGFAKVPEDAIRKMKRQFSFPEEEQFPPSKWGFKSIDVIVHRVK